MVDTRDERIRPDSLWHQIRKLPFGVFLHEIEFTLGPDSRLELVTSGDDPQIRACWESKPGEHAPQPTIGVHADERGDLVLRLARGTLGGLCARKWHGPR